MTSATPRLERSIGCSAPRPGLPTLLHPVLSNHAKYEMKSMKSTESTQYWVDWMNDANDGYMAMEKIPIAASPSIYPLTSNI